MIELCLGFDTTLAMARDPGLEGSLELHLLYSRDDGNIHEAWVTGEPDNKVYWLPLSVAYELLGGRNDATRAYLDDVAADLQMWEAS